MESFKKVISLSQAASFSGYSQDYLGFLIRQGEIKGLKKGRAWFTTEEEIKNYIFKKKVRSSHFAIRGFFSLNRAKNIIIAAIIIFVGGFLLLSYFNKSSQSPVNEIRSAETSDGDSLSLI